MNKKPIVDNKSKTKPTSKETVYIDVDDEITHIIDKIKSSESSIVALVLPKRATTLLSLVNMKLLKRSADSAKKHIVLITTESSLMPLAGAAGVYVAKSLQSRPEIPRAPVSVSEADIEDLDDGAEIIDQSQSIGALSATKAVDADDDDIIEFDNISTDDLDSLPGGSKAVDKKSKKPKKDKKLKVPNFERFRLGIVLAVLAVILLIGGWFLAVVVLPKAKVTIATDTTSVVSSFDFTASTSLDSVDEAGRKLPAVAKETKKTDSEKGTASGERDEGTRASGKVTLSESCSSGFMTTIPAGTAVSSGDLSYITQEKATLSSPSGGGSNCVFSDTVKVIATANGEKYNLDKGKTLTVAGNNSVTAKTSNDIDGGTSKIVKYVTQKDVDAAVERINKRQADTLKDELASGLTADNLFALKETFTSSEPKVQSSPGVDSEASEFTVSYEVNFSMLGIKRSDLTQLIKDDVKDEVDLQKQSIIDDGIDSAVMKLNNAGADKALVSFRTSVVAGPELNEAEIKEAIRGKKYGEVESHIKSLKGVKDVTVDYSPFWVYSTPKATKKITIVIEKPSVANDSKENDGSND